MAYEVPTGYEMRAIVANFMAFVIAEKDLFRAAKKSFNLQLSIEAEHAANVGLYKKWINFAKGQPSSQR